ncbi:hypothetical protein [Streptomyces sp. NPDC014622]|uniref:hypothetical protein n=1 Tax=Streptomyces sp. NPDC014622 TaxID=3364874 RepID=UPI0036FECBCD
MLGDGVDVLLAGRGRFVDEKRPVASTNRPPVTAASAAEWQLFPVSRIWARS